MEDILGIAGIGAMIYFTIPLIKSFLPKDNSNPNTQRLRIMAVFIVSFLIAVVGIASRGDYGAEIQEVIKGVLSVFGAAQIIYLSVEKLLGIGIDENVEKTLRRS